MTAAQVYKRAMALINERDSGGAYHSDVSDFEHNAPELINSLVTLMWLDQCIIEERSVRDFAWDFEPITSLNDEIPLHESLVSGALPFGLASLLLLEEDSQRADYFYRLYVNARDSVVASFASTKRTSVQDIY